MAFSISGRACADPKLVDSVAQTLSYLNGTSGRLLSLELPMQG